MMNAHALTIFKVLRKQFSEEDANVVVESIEEITKEKISEQEVYTTKSIQHQVEQKIDFSVEQKIEKEHKYLATKEDIMVVREELQSFKEDVNRQNIALEGKTISVKEDIMVVREELQSFKEDVNRQNIALEGKTISVKEDIMTVREELQSFKEDVHRKIVAVEEKIVAVGGKIVSIREDMIKQYRSFFALNMALFAIIITILIYLVAKV